MPKDDTFKSPLDEALFKQNMYWKIIVSLQKKIQQIISDNENLRDELMLWETGSEPIQIVEKVPIGKRVKTGVSPGHFDYQGGETSRLNLPYHNYQLAKPKYDPNDQKLLDSLDYKSLTKLERKVLAVYYNPNGSAYNSPKLTANAIYGKKDKNGSVKVCQTIKRIERKLNKS
tara:strand:- start:80 stop:598 length:519 start_codon:yes stop_codon:yes gene_type:complete